MRSAFTLLPKSQLVFFVLFRRLPFTQCQAYSNTTVRAVLLIDDNKLTTRMWANAQRDGRPAEHRWRPLFNAANFG